MNGGDVFENHSEAVLEVLRRDGLVGPAELAILHEEHRTSGRPVAALALDMGLVERPALLASVANALGCEVVLDLPESLPAEAVGLISAERGRDYGVIPLRAGGGAVDLLALDPFESRTMDDLAFALQKEVRLVVADPPRVAALIRRHYGEDEATMEDVLRQMDAARTVASSGDDISVEELTALAGQTTIVRFVNRVLDRAVREHASDVHFEPFEDAYKLRYRIDGALYEMPPPPRSLVLPITSRLKVLANLDIAERRMPQDGRIRLVVAGRAVDLRISTLPTQCGESVVLRVLDQSAVQLDLAQLGMSPEVLAGVSEVVRRPNGIFIVTGPTGSGKTTTLYSGLRSINATDLKILTAEDPVEYELEGVMQVPVNPAVGLTFASALRSFLRQDPDVIMVGEIRDLETAQMAIQAALTGHLVLTTLHTNDAAGAVTRLIDMGVEPFLIASTLEAVLAQRLVRRSCPECRQHEELGEAGPEASHRGFQRRGCAHCNGTGYRGRRGIYEWLPMTEALRELVVARAPTGAIRRQAVEQGMRTLRDEGLQAVANGETTMEEVSRHV